jgi:hypothetical protein
MQSIEDDVRKLGIRTFPIPLGLKRNEAAEQSMVPARTQAALRT